MENISLYIIFSIYNYSFHCPHPYPIYSSPQPSFTSCLEGDPTTTSTILETMSSVQSLILKERQWGEENFEIFHGKKCCKHPLVVQNYQT